MLLLAGDWLLFFAYPLPTGNFDYSSVGVPSDWPHHLRGMAAHWDKNTNLAAAADHWFLGHFPHSSDISIQPGRLCHAQFRAFAGDHIFGLLAGGLLRSERSQRQKFGLLIAAGLLGLLLGWGLDAAGLCPLVKRIWTPSWALFSTGWALLFLAAFYSVVDMLGFRRWTFPLVVVGMNSIVMYVMAELIPDWLASRLQVHIGQTSSRCGAMSTACTCPSFATPACSD